MSLKPKDARLFINSKIFSSRHLFKFYISFILFLFLELILDVGSS